MFIIPVLILSGAIMGGAASKRGGIYTPQLVYEIIRDEEETIAKALSTRDTASLDNSVDRLGFIVDAAIERVKRGGTISECEMAAQSLDNMAIMVNRALAKDTQQDFMSILIDGAGQSLDEFKVDIKNCENELHKTSRSRRALDEAYKGLKNG
jgi:hypothetical protein